MLRMNISTISHRMSFGRLRTAFVTGRRDHIYRQSRIYSPDITTGLGIPRLPPILSPETIAARVSYL